MRVGFEVQVKANKEKEHVLRCKVYGLRRACVRWRPAVPQQHPILAAAPNAPTLPPPPLPNHNMGRGGDA